MEKGKYIILFLILIIIGVLAWIFWPRKVISPFAEVKFTQNSLEKYDFDNLAKRQGIASNIEILGKIKAVEDRRAAAAKAMASQGKNKYDFETREIRFLSDGKKISGMMNIPEGATTRVAHTPVVIMIRGYAEKENYFVGSGTLKVADELAKAGFVTISLDFLGYGNSDSDSSDVLEARFHKVVEVLDLIESIKQLPWVDKNKIGIWAHSNGGQIALSVLEITGQKYPTILWAPMTNPFPQSLIDTADEGEERQKATDFVNLFLKYYDGRRYAFENYYEWINAPILIQQGTADSLVKVEWQTDVFNKLKLLNKDVELIIYDGADHNMNPAAAGWTKAVGRDIEWYNDRLYNNL